jgi:hypothetical protein
VPKYRDLHDDYQCLGLHSENRLNACIKQVLGRQHNQQMIQSLRSGSPQNNQKACVNSALIRTTVTTVSLSLQMIISLPPLSRLMKQTATVVSLES